MKKDYLKNEKNEICLMLMGRMGWKTEEWFLRCRHLFVVPSPSPSVVLRRSLQSFHPFWFMSLSHTLRHLSEISFLSKSTLSEFHWKWVMFVLKNHPSQYSISLLSARPEGTGALTARGFCYDAWLHCKSLLSPQRALCSHPTVGAVCGVTHDPQKGRRRRCGLIFCD